MLSNWFLKSFRILLFPFALLYGAGVLLRNWLYNKKIFTSTSFALPVICVGNLSVGGTGKSPTVELIVRMFKDRYRLATLSRGYKRKTKGYVLASPLTTSIDIGDEPMQFHRKFPDLPVAVGEERLVAIPQLLHDRPETEVIILDDAYQHRAIKAGLNILLTDCGNLFTRDFFLPTGDLRDARNSYKRAHIIIVTKCPPGLTPVECDDLVKEIDPVNGQEVFFTAIYYGTPFHITGGDARMFPEETEILLVTGIANPGPLKEYLEQHSLIYHMIQYSDHHIFTIDDWRDIRRKFDQLANPSKILLTTEKDAMRLLKFDQELRDLPFYVIPIEHRFLFGGETAFMARVDNFIKSFQKPS